MATIPGLITRRSAHSVRETIDRLEALLHSKGIKVFARIDQAAEAKAAGLEMNAMELLLFGNPKGGTPVMLAVPESGIDLPLKAMAWEGRDGFVRISYNDPEYLRSRFDLPADVVRPLAAAVALIETIV